MLILIMQYPDGSKDITEHADEKSVKKYLDSTYRDRIIIRIYKEISFTYTPPVSSLVIG